ncbi:MAG: murein L,D-transpeptidase catalytic domain family protein [Bacteroidia bacterium]|nr:murein L,D-transpeptidase catalytic domain family protein [Bacteroidia bacterium]
MVVLIIHLYFFAQAMLVNEGLAERPVTKEPAVHAAKTEAEILYDQLEGCLEKEAFTAAWQGMLRYNPEARMLAIADLSQASDKQRFYIINLEKKEVNLQTWVAHGKNSGDQYALNFSNTNASHMSSRGFFRIGEEFISPKHGPALLLEGLEKGVNDRARMREIIIHGADYVSEDFIETHGRCGRSHGCPALPREEMAKVIRLLPPGSLLYIHTAS